MKYKKGQTLGLAIMLAIIIFIVGFLMINFLKDQVTQTRIDLNCASPDDITDGTKLLCLAIDSTVPYWILLIFSISIGLITERFVTSTTARFS